MDKLNVKVNSNSSGNLIKEDNEFIFSYDCEEKNNFISLLMPVRSKPFIHNKLHPIFEMHLPEGYLLSIIKKHFSKLTKTDDFGLLKVMSNSIKGRLSYESNFIKADDSLSLDDLLHTKKDNLFDELVTKFALNSALSGVQPKVLALIKNKTTLKVDDYIVKSWGTDYKELALNEYYCMEIVRRSNIEVPEFYISDDEKLFIMKRFDKVDDKYIGFEDMCVLMGKQRDDKYEGSHEQIVKTIKTFVSPQHKKSSLIQFFKMTYLNFLLKNGDAHLKNFGLIYTGIDDIQLAPAYDVVSTTVYIKNDIPALLLLGSKKWWDNKYIERFGIQTCDLTKKEINEAISECDNAIKIVKNQLSIRLESESNEDKKELLKKLIDCFI
ncbi:HipA N-terminal domain protein [Arcobacter nitrofigilis DSM 7299]|uniref:HipA N-terminal domain protein n=1 Tax=Arcobacter nitrofigilis (strain ATCC 33309 / DSM 7299 / CCUG 15893 / LMG 7604 / NCTC 12251 / CI) TaxID=572480 RepID=D5V3C3_ARCNC|nr:type II toxin-antitoxin system HipA family toxin [Arcobacter nitrofigilis]ADG92705.1 HipA N-terminal domain protein [Arcobacter nitrofigilis DSM 7299]